MRASTLESQPESGTLPVQRLRVLLVDDTRERAEILALLKANERFLVSDSDDLEDRAAWFYETDVVLCELAPGQELAVLEDRRRAGSNVPVIIVTSRGDEYWAAEAIKRGAADYLSKQPGYLARLSAAILAVTRASDLHKNGFGANGSNGLISSNANEQSGTLARATDDIKVYTSILNALPVHIAMLDERGKIRAVNDAWRKYALDCHYQHSEHLPGTDYMEVCDAAVTAGIEKATEIADGMRRVFAGRCSTFACEYPYQYEGVQRWFKFAASALQDDRHRGAMIAHVDITDRKQAELERDQLFEQSLSLLCIGGFDGLMRRWSRSVKVLGYTPAELPKLSLWSLLHPDDRELALQMGQQLRSGEMVTTTEMRVRSKDGTYRWILWDAVPCLEQDLFFATGQDITDRKVMEQQLSESHQRFQLIASATRESIWDWDLRENRLWQNESYLEIFGKFDPTTETPVEWWRRRIHPDDRERIMDIIPRASVDGKHQWVLEYRLERLDGSYAYVYDRGFVIFDAEQRPVRMVGSIIDITDLKTAEDKLRESEERFRLAAKATRDAIWDWDRSRDYVWRSKGFQSLFGYEAHEIEPTFAWWTERIHPDDRDRVKAQLPDLERFSSPQCSFEYRFRRKDGTYADVIDRGFVMLNAEGEPVRMVGSIMDVSERRRAETLAHMHQAELAHRSRISTMGEIATGIAHELNQPLTAISNYAESCVRAIGLRASEGDQKLLEWIGKIANNTHRAAEMIRRLRSFTRKSEPKKSTLDANEIVTETIDLLEAETRLKSFRVRWQPQPAMAVRVDRIQIEQVLVNLIRNAYDAMQGNHGADRSVTLSLEQQADQVHILVADRGEGISPENLERVFDAFFTNKPNGVGIGLAISRSIVEDHGGRLWVEPNPDRGVTFRFTLPLSGDRE
jgi:PAS domain S-box-containing protein